MYKLEKCQAPWGCKSPSAKGSGDQARHIGGKPYCRVCYQYAWAEATKNRIAIARRAEFVKTLPGPLLSVPDRKLRCKGPKCGKILPANAPANERRFVRRTRGLQLVVACRGCYQQAYEYAKAHDPMTIEEAFFKMPPRKRRT